MEVVAAATTVLDVLDVVKFIYRACRSGVDAAASVPAAEARVDELLATATRAQKLLQQIDRMDARDKAPLQHSLTKLALAAEAVRSYLAKYLSHSVTKLFRLPALAAEINKFDDAVAALLVEFQLATGAFLVGHSARQELFHEELMRGIRALLQDNESRANKPQSEELLSSTRRQEHGAVAHAKEEGDVVTLLVFLRKKDDDQAEPAAIALCELVEADATEDTVAAATIQSLVEMLGEKTKANRVLVAHALHRLAGCGHVDSKMQDANPVPALAGMVRAGEQHATETERTAACAALSRLAANSELRTAFLEYDGLVERLVELVHNSADAQQQQFVMAALRALASHERECVTRIAECEAIPVLVDLLYVGDTPEIRFDALGALWHLASVEANRAEIADENAIKAIVDQVKSGDSQEHAQLGASMLAVLAQDDVNDQKIADAGGVEPLVKLLISGTTTQRRSAAWALAELADHSGNANKMIQVGATRALLGSFRSATDLQRRSNAGLALTRIAQFANEKEALVNDIGLKSIVSLLRESRATDQKQHAAALLSGIASTQEVQDELRKLGAIEMLVDLVRHHSPKQHGVDALRALAKGNKDNQIRIQESGGIDVLFEVLAASHKEDAMGEANQDEDAIAAMKALIKIVATEELKTKLVSEGRASDLIRAVEAARDSLPLQRLVVLLLASMAGELKKDAASEAACVSLLLEVAKRKQPADVVLESFACLTLARVLVGPHTYQELSDFVPDLWELSSKRSSNRATRLDTVRTLHLLTLRVESRELVVSSSGVEALLVVVKEGPDNVVDLAVRALLNLTKTPSGNLISRKLGALKIVSSAWNETVTHARAFVALELLSLLPSDWEQLARVAKRNIVRYALVALRWKSAEISQLGSTILTRIRKEASHTDVVLHHEPYNLDEYVKDLRDMDGAKTLLAHLDSVTNGATRASTLALLAGLTRDFGCRKDVQQQTVSRMAALVGVVRYDSPTEAVEAAKLIASLVNARENATEAIKAGLINAFQKFTQVAEIEVAAKVECLSELLRNLRQCWLDAKTTIAPAIAMMIEYLAVQASRGEESAANETACLVLVNVADSIHDNAIFSEVGLSKCVAAVEEAYRSANSVDSQQFRRVSAIVAAHLQHSFGSPEELFKLYKSKKLGRRACMIRLMNDVAKVDKRAKRSVRNGLRLHELLDVLDDGNDDEKMAAAEAVVTLIDADDNSMLGTIKRVCVSFAQLLKTHPDAMAPMVTALIHAFCDWGDESGLEEMAWSLLVITQGDILDHPSQDAACGVLCVAMALPAVKNSAQVMTTILNGCGQIFANCEIEYNWRHVYAILNHMIEHGCVAVCDPVMQNKVMLVTRKLPQSSRATSLSTFLRRSRVESSVASLRSGSVVERTKIAKHLVEWMYDEDDCAVAIRVGAVDAFIHLVRSSVKARASDVNRCVEEFFEHLRCSPNLLVEKREFVSGLAALAFAMQPEDGASYTATYCLKRMASVGSEDGIGDGTVELLLAACSRVVEHSCEEDPESLKCWADAPSYVRNAVNILERCMSINDDAITDGVLELLLSMFRVSGSIQPLDKFIERLEGCDTHRDVKLCQSGYVAAVVQRVIQLPAMDDEQLDCIKMLTTLCWRYDETAVEIRPAAADLLAVCDAILTNDKDTSNASVGNLVLEVVKDEVIGVLIMEHDTILESAVQSVIDKDYHLYCGTLKQLYTRDDVRAKLEALDLDELLCDQE